MISSEKMYSAPIFVMHPDVKLGDLLIHEGSAVEAQQHAAQVYTVDKTLFLY